MQISSPRDGGMYTMCKQIQKSGRNSCRQPESAMSDPDTEHRYAVALFRYGLIAELIHRKPGSGLYQRIREKEE